MDKILNTLKDLEQYYLNLGELDCARGIRLAWEYAQDLNLWNDITEDTDQNRDLLITNGKEVWIDQLYYDRYYGVVGLRESGLITKEHKWMEVPKTYEQLPKKDN